MASLSLGVQQYSSGIGHHVVESKVKALHAVETGVYVRFGPISIVDLAHLAILRLFLTSVGWDTLASSNSPAFDVLLVNSKRVLTPSRRGWQTWKELRFRVSLGLLSFSVRPRVSTWSAFWFFFHEPSSPLLLNLLVNSIYLYSCHRSTHKPDL